MPTRTPRSPEPHRPPGRGRHNHDLRHTHGTLLIKSGIPVKVVSERPGHGNPTFTIDTYQRVLPGTQAEAARMFESLIVPEASTG